MGSSRSKVYPDPANPPTCPICGSEVEMIDAVTDTYETDDPGCRLIVTTQIHTLTPCRHQIEPWQSLEMVRAENAAST